MTVDGISPAALAERYVLGAIFTDPRVLRDVQSEVLPRDFEDMRLGAIYAGVCRMAAEREPIDVLTVADHLADWDVRGIDLGALAGWARDVPTATNAGYYARMIRERSLSRSLDVVAGKLRGAAEPTLALADAITELKDLRDRDASSTAKVRMLADVLNVPEQEDAYDWVIPDVLERRDRLMLTGSEGGGKSTMLRQLAVLSAAGVHPFRFSPVDPIRVLVVDAENSERQWRRAVRGMADRAAQVGARDPRHQVALECTPRIDITRDVNDIHRRIDEVRPDLLLIGPLYRLTPRAIKDDDDAAPVLAALDSLRDRDVAMLIEAHAGHASSATGERDLRPRGSSALLGWPEFGLGLRRDKQVDAGGRVKFSLVRWRGDRDQRQLPGKFARGDYWPWEPSLSVHGMG